MHGITAGRSVTPMSYLQSIWDTTLIRKFPGQPMRENGTVADCGLSISIVQDIQLPGPAAVDAILSMLTPLYFIPEGEQRLLIAPRIMARHRAKPSGADSDTMDFKESATFRTEDRNSLHL